MKTYTPKSSEVTREWHVVDAEGMIIGRMATEVARLLRGKHKPTYTPNIDMGCLLYTSTGRYETTFASNDGPSFPVTGSIAYDRITIDEYPVGEGL